MILSDKPRSATLTCGLSHVCLQLSQKLTLSYSAMFLVVHHDGAPFPQAFAAAMLAEGLLVIPLSFPVVAKGKARIR